MAESAGADRAVPRSPLEHTPGRPPWLSTPTSTATTAPRTAQPPPRHVPGAPSVHDLVSADVSRSWLLRRFAVPLMVLLAERRAFGLRKYGTVLQVEDPRRRPEFDLLEELGDALVYAYRLKARGVPGARIVYWSLRVLAAVTAYWWYPVVGADLLRGRGGDQ